MPTLMLSVHSIHAARLPAAFLSLWVSVHLSGSRREFGQPEVVDEEEEEEEEEMQQQQPSESARQGENEKGKKRMRDCLHHGKKICNRRAIAS